MIMRVPSLCPLLGKTAKKSAIFSIGHVSEPKAGVLRALRLSERLDDKSHDHPSSPVLPPHGLACASAAGDPHGAPGGDDPDALDTQQEHEEEPAPATQPEASQWHHGNRRICARVRLEHNRNTSPEKAPISHGADLVLTVRRVRILPTGPL